MNMISYKRLLAFLIGLAYDVQTTKAQCGKMCGLYGGLGSVATLNFNLKNCELGDGTWIKLDCPKDLDSGSLWEVFGSSLTLRENFN